MRPYNLTSTFQKILSFQSAFRSTFSASLPQFRTMSSTPSPSPTDPDITRTISYWFDGPNPMKKWFGGGPSVDAEIRNQFLPLVEKAARSELKSWASNANGSLALLILLDQFPRNLYRGSPLSYSSDSMALDVAARGIARGFHREVPSIQTQLFYLPFMHAESLVSQVAAIALYEGLVERCEADSELKELIQGSLEFSKRHAKCIMTFGRFPSRNEALGRESTTEEVEYLKEHPSGF